MMKLAYISIYALLYVHDIKINIVINSLPAYNVKIL